MASPIRTITDENVKGETSEFVAGSDLRRRVKTTACVVNQAVWQRLGLDTGQVCAIELIERVLAGGDQSIETLKDDPKRSFVRHVAVNDLHFVVKRYRVPIWKARSLHWLRLTPTWREWRGAQKLARSRRRVNAPLAMAFQPTRGVEAQAIVFPYVEGRALDQVIQIAPPPQQWSETYRRRRIELARTVGRQLGMLLSSGLVNRDHKLSNLIMDRACEQQGDEPIIIDALGLRRRRGNRQVHRMLATLLRTSERAGAVTPRECLTCLKAVLRADPSLARNEARRLNRLARQVLSVLGRGGSRPNSER